MAILLEPEAWSPETTARRSFSRPSPDACVVECPFVVAIDQQEQAPWSFRGIVSRCTSRSSPADVLAVKTVRKHLVTADYSIEGEESKIVIERKSKDDLYKTLTHERDRFVRELERMRDLPVAVIIVESSLGGLTIPPPGSRALPQSIEGSIISIQQEFPTIQWVFGDTRRLAEEMAFRHLERFYREHLKPRRSPKSTKAKALPPP